MDFLSGIYTLNIDTEDLRFLEKEDCADQILTLNCVDKGVRVLPAHNPSL